MVRLRWSHVFLILFLGLCARGALCSWSESARFAHVQQTAVVRSLPGSGLNPLDRAKVLEFELSAAQNVGLGIYDVSGAAVRWFPPSVYPVGRHQFVWDGQRQNGHVAPTGLYVARFDFPDRQTRMLLWLQN